uniref:Uncharacterized protein n=1 Tax=Timema douglasi TaxID=61478 RepID=A0A7R8VFF4_TIMDO|nr:unnamed protein product [Timema douglasi]
MLHGVASVKILFGSLVLAARGGEYISRRDQVSGLSRISCSNCLAITVLRTDALIQKTVRRKFADCTVLTIAHRLLTVMDSDRTLVMDAGNVVELDHPYLLMENKNGFLYNMVQETGKSMAETLYKMAESRHFISRGCFIVYTRSHTIFVCGSGKHKCVFPRACLRTLVCRQYMSVGTGLKGDTSTVGNKVI